MKNFKSALPGLLAIGMLLAGCRPVEPNTVVQARMLSTETASWEGDFEYLKHYFPIRPEDQVILNGPNRIKIIVNNSFIEFLVAEDSCTTVINGSSGFVVITSERNSLFYPANKDLKPGDTYTTATSPKIDGSTHNDNGIKVTVTDNACSSNINNQVLLITDEGYFVQ